MDRKEALDKMQICQPYKCRGKADLKMTHWLFAKKPSNNLLLRDRPRFFDQVGHQTSNASIGNKHFFTK